MIKLKQENYDKVIKTISEVEPTDNTVNLDDEETYIREANKFAEKISNMSLKDVKKLIDDYGFESKGPEDEGERIVYNAIWERIDELETISNNKIDASAKSELSEEYPHQMAEKCFDWICDTIEHTGAVLRPIYNEILDYCDEYQLDSENTCSAYAFEKDGKEHSVALCYKSPESQELCCFVDGVEYKPNEEDFWEFLDRGYAKVECLHEQFECKAFDSVQSIANAVHEMSDDDVDLTNEDEIALWLEWNLGLKGYDQDRYAKEVIDYINYESSTSLTEETLDETYSEDELNDMIGKTYNQQKIMNIYRRKKYDDKRLFAHTRCTNCGREKKVFLSNLINDPDKYGSCVCSDTNVESRLDNIKGLYAGTKKLSSNTSGYTGVSYVKNYNGKIYDKWRAYIEIDGKRTYLGDFDSKAKAIKARKAAAEEGIEWYKEHKNSFMKNTRRKTKRYKQKKTTRSKKK